MAEALLNHSGEGRFTALSAGSNPVPEVHPVAVKVLENAGFDMTGKRPKSLQEYIHEDFDFIITLCDKMKETCPVFPGQPIFAHWGMPDPADFDGDETEKVRAFETTLRELSHRIHLFLNIPIDKLDRMALEQKVKEIGY
jgi:arsenate reductase